MGLLWGMKEDMLQVSNSVLISEKCQRKRRAKQKLPSIQKLKSLNLIKFSLLSENLILESNYYYDDVIKKLFLTVNNKSLFPYFFKTFFLSFFAQILPLVLKMLYFSAKRCGFRVSFLLFLNFQSFFLKHSPSILYLF